MHPGAAPFHTSSGGTTSLGGRERPAARQGDSRGLRIEEAHMSADDKFRDRIDAGRRLARELAGHAERKDVLVLGLARGGMPVAYEVARALGVALDIFLVRKLSVPGQEELSLGAVATGGIRVLEERLIRELALPDDAIALAAADQQQELERRERAYRSDRPDLEVDGRIVILVDDGMVTGSTVRVATAALRARDPARIIAAVPVAPAAACDRIRDLVDEMICISVPDDFEALDAWYHEFPDVSDAQVGDLLDRAGREYAGRDADRS